MSMPKPLMKALFRVLRLSDEYVGSLCLLDAIDVNGVARKYWRDRKRIQAERGREG